MKNKVLRFNDWSLRAKLAALLVAASVVPLCISGYLDIRETRGQLVSAKQNELAARADQIVSEFDSIHGAYQRAIDRVALYPDVVAYCERPAAESRMMSDHMLKVFGAYPASDVYVRGAGIITADGRMALTTERQLLGTDMSNRSSIKAAQAGHSVISGIYVSGAATGSLPSVSYLAPVHNSKGQVSCIVGLWIHADAFWKELKAANNLAGPGSYAVIFDASGVRIGYTTAQEHVFHPAGPIEPATRAILLAENRFGPATAALLDDVHPFSEQFNRARAPQMDDSVFRGISPVNKLTNYGVGRRLKSVPWTVFYMAPESELEAQLDAASWQRTRESTDTALRLADEVERYKVSEARQLAHLERLKQLDQIATAIGERQDLQSIYQVAIGSLEAGMNLAFACICSHDTAHQVLTLVHMGVRSHTLSEQLGLIEETRIPIDENGLSRCVQGQLVYEPDIATSAFPFPRRMAQGGLRSMVLAPLSFEGRVFGVLVAARAQADAFSSGDCEFLRQLSSHVALAAHQAQLYDTLRKAYDDLHQSQQAALQQERLSALGQMASGIAHDINNAISPVALYTETLLENEPGLSERARNYLEIISRAIDDVAATVSRMREFSRQREPQALLLPLDINAMVRQVVDLTHARWSDMPQQKAVAIELRTELASGLPKVMGIESEIREALTNLVFNAVDAMPQGGTLTLRSFRAGPGPSGPAGRQRVVLEIGDTGQGMSEETRRRCFEPFYTTKGERGTGLGLAMVYGMAQRHAAHISIDSAPGAGTVARLEFNVPDTQSALAPGDKPADIRPAAPLRLLVVDDDPILLRSLCESLRGDGHEVIGASGGEAGIAAFRASLDGGPAFDVVFTDLGMPHLGGREVAAAIKQMSRATPVILLTGWGQRLADNGDTPTDIDIVLSKPARIRELREALVRSMEAAQ
jgi:signal transduction histidine kinase/ActR/RegA family two-component response regulator